MPNKLSQFWQELKRRKVVRVITVYAAAAFVILELVDMIIEPFGLPNWTFKLVVVILSIGLVVSIILSWVFDVTPEGVQKTPPIKEDKGEMLEKPSRLMAWKITSYVSIAIILGLVLFNLFGTGKKVNWEDLDRTIAVLPFENLVQEDLSTVLNNTLPIALITELQNIEGFTIRPWLSTKRYKETDQRSTEIGNELNVNFLVKGFLTQQGSNTEVDIWLIDAASEEVIRSYNRKMETSNILQVRRDISKQVASIFNNNFSPDATVLTGNSDAEQAYFTGLNYYWASEAKEDFLLAINYFNKAIQLDPAFSMAYVWLSSSNSWMYHFYHDRTEERLSMARNAFEKAYVVDPENPHIFLAEGNYFYVIHEFDRTLELFNKAAEHLSESFELNLISGSLFRRRGDMEKAIDYYLIAEELSPQNKTAILEIAETYLLLHQFELAETYYKKYSLIGGRSSGIVNAVCLYLLWEKGNEKSRRALNERRGITNEKDNSTLAHYQVKISLIDRKYDEALNALRTLSADSIHNQFIFRPKALYYAEVYWMQDNLELAEVYYDSARIYLENKISISENDHRYHSALGMAFAGLGRKDEAVREGLTSVELMPVTKDYYRGIFCLEDLACIYTKVGDLDNATETLSRLLSMPSLISVPLLKKEPVWDPLIEYPGFMQMISTYTTSQ